MAGNFVRLHLGISKFVKSLQCMVVANTSLARVAMALLVMSFLSACGARAPSSCDRLAGINLDGTQIVAITTKSAGYEFSLPGAFVGIPFFKMPASCRISLELHPSSDSKIKSLVWLPKTEWNGKFLGIGNGGFAGSIDTLSLTFALQKGYAVAATDTGHQGNDKDGSWALGHPEKIRDYGYRAIHETTVKAKQIIFNYYGKPADYAYFSSCSNGGRAALMEAQRFPADYDGIVAGAPAYYPSSMLSGWGWMQQQADRPKAYIPDTKLAIINQAVLSRCDKLDGVEDGVLDDPRTCRFDPAAIQCAGDNTDDCLTPEQVQTLNAIYAGPGGALEGFPLHGLEVGGEVDSGGWNEWVTGSQPKAAYQYIYVQEFIRHLVYNNADWSMADFDYQGDQLAMRAAFKQSVDAVDADLSDFAARGGKLILYHGWSDAALPPRSTIDYYNAVRQKLGNDLAENFVRLYMVPGMGHCFGGSGANSFGILPPAGNADPQENVNAALEAWVEKGVMPQIIVAKKFSGNPIAASINPNPDKLIFSRPLCPYPLVARWKGSGSRDHAENFHCIAP